MVLVECAEVREKKRNNFFHLIPLFVMSLTPLNFILSLLHFLPWVSLTPPSSISFLEQWHSHSSSSLICTARHAEVIARLADRQPSHQVTNLLIIVAPTKLVKHSPQSWVVTGFLRFSLVCGKCCLMGFVWFSIQ